MQNSRVFSGATSWHIRHILTDRLQRYTRPSGKEPVVLRELPGRATLPGRLSMLAVHILGSPLAAVAWLAFTQLSPQIRCIY